MAANRQDIAEWFDTGRKLKATHMIVVCDTYDWEDYPVYAKNDEECNKQYKALNGPNMQKVMEVYDLRKNKQDQLSRTRVMNLPN